MKKIIIALLALSALFVLLLYPSCKKDDATITF